MEFLREISSFTLVYCLSGRLTFRDSDAFQDLLDDIRLTAQPWVRFDLKGLEYIDSYGIGLIIPARDKARKHGKDLALSNPFGKVRELPRLTAIGTVLTVMDAAAD